MGESCSARPQPLVGGRSTEGIVRIGGMVHRPMTARAPFVHDVLRQLESVGFTGAPRYRGVDQEGREILTYVEGRVPHGAEPGAWTDEQLRRAARVLRAFHDATADSVLAGDEEVVCHNDYAPWNTVFVAGLPTAMIDFDDARPGPRVRDVAYALWCWLALGAAAMSIQEQSRRIALMCEAYGLGDRHLLVSQLALRQQEIFAQHTRNGWFDRARIVAAEIEWWQANAIELLAYE